jgi:hypothetical protein
MISNKAPFELMFIVLGVIPIAFASINPKTSHSSKRPTISGKQKFASKSKQKSVFTLEDTNNEVRDVQAGGETNIDVNSIQKRVPLVNEQFKKLMDQGRYDDIVQLGDAMSKGEYSIQACLLVKTIDQYNGIVKHPRRFTMIPAFFVYGDRDVVEEAIAAESRFYGDDYLIHDEDLKFAVSVAFKIDRHDRIIELLEIRRKATAKEDEWSEHVVKFTSFGAFLGNFFHNFVPVRGSVPLKRFLTFKEDEFKNRNPYLYDIF